MSDETAIRSFMKYTKNLLCQMYNVLLKNKCTFINWEMEGLYHYNKANDVRTISLVTAARQIFQIRNTSIWNCVMLAEFQFRLL